MRLPNFVVITGSRDRRVACAFSKQAYYWWCKNPVSWRDLDIHRDDPAFGYRLIADELNAVGVNGQREPGPAPVLSAGDLVRKAQSPLAVRGGERG